LTLWAVPSGRAERLAMAQAYPFEIPEGSYLFRDGHVEPLASAPDLRGRTPVLAVGSNQAPDQLARKYAHVPGTVIPVTRAWLEDFDVCYATHITRYGSIPSNLHACPGMRVRLSITWLDDEQLRIMHPTEIAGESYAFARLDGLALETTEGQRLASAFAYLSLHGVMRLDGAPLGLAAMAAERRPHPAARQIDALAALHRRCGSAGDFEEFVLAPLDDAGERAWRTALLRSDSYPFDWPRMQIIEGI
jgi:hypothetical protein